MTDTTLTITLSSKYSEAAVEAVKDCVANLCKETRFNLLAQADDKVIVSETEDNFSIEHDGVDAENEEFFLHSRISSILQEY